MMYRSVVSDKGHVRGPPRGGEIRQGMDGVLGHGLKDHGIFESLQSGDLFV